MISQLERWPDVVDEFRLLIDDHYEELALDKDKVPLNVDWDRYMRLYEAGVLLFVSLRDEGKLVGYFIGFVMPHLHYVDCVTCAMDIYFVHPSVRGRFGGLRLLRQVERILRANGVHRWTMGSKNHAPSDRLFAAMGFKPIETYHSKWLGD
jgi:L-amino acid N-acyltransferase YncA